MDYKLYDTEKTMKHLNFLLRWVIADPISGYVFGCFQTRKLARLFVHTLMDHDIKITLVY